MTNTLDTTTQNLSAEITSATPPSNISYAEEVKAERLVALYRVTMAISVFALLGIFTFGTMTEQSSSSVIMWMATFGIFLVTGFLTRTLLKRVGLSAAAWVYTLGGVVAISMLLYQPGQNTLEIVPFIFPVIIFIGGLLLSPVSTFGVMLLSAVAVVAIPMLNNPNSIFTLHQFSAIILMIISAVLGAQVTGELYRITQWALLNYKKERNTNKELFEKRQQLQLSLKRSEILREKVQEARDEAEEAKHFRGQFLANMSHELRTPLNAIIGFSETMLQFPIMYDNTELPAAYKRDLSQIYDSGRQLLHVINDILDLARVDAGKLEIHMQPVNPGLVINAAMATSKGLLGSKPVKLQKDIPDDLPTLWVDETRLRQVLLNIYSNACKYTDDGYIKLTITELDDSDELQFAIEDTGTGIDPEFHDALFEEFQQAKHKGRNPRSGSGLGLAISRQLLDLMGGRIWMESTPGEGSTFYFAVQLYDGQDDESQQAGQPKEVSLKQTGVYDQPDTAEEAKVD